MRLLACLMCYVGYPRTDSHCSSENYMKYSHESFHPRARVSILYHCLQEVALLSRSAIEEARRHLPGFPAAEHLPRPTHRTPEGRFQYVPGAWTAATNASVVTEFRGTNRKYDPTKWRQLRTDFCDIWSLALEEVATPTAQFFPRTRGLCVSLPPKLVGAAIASSCPLRSS